MISSYPQDAYIQISASGFADRPSDPLRSLPLDVAIWRIQEYLLTSALIFCLPLLIFHQNKEPMLIFMISKACIKVTWVHPILLQLSISAKTTMLSFQNNMTVFFNCHTSLPTSCHTLFNNSQVDHLKM